MYSHTAPRKNRADRRHGWRALIQGSARASGYLGHCAGMRARGNGDGARLLDVLDLVNGVRQDSVMMDPPDAPLALPALAIALAAAADQARRNIGLAVACPAVLPPPALPAAAAGINLTPKLRISPASVRSPRAV